jgi:hypothetical protein
VSIEYLIPLKNTAITQGEHVFFDIDVKGGEKVWFGCYSWRSKQNSAFLQGCHQCKRGRLLACLTGRMLLSLMARIAVNQTSRVCSNQSSKEIEIALCAFQKCSRGPKEGLAGGTKVETFEHLENRKLRRKNDSGHWITNPEYPMTIRSSSND